MSINLESITFKAGSSPNNQSPLKINVGSVLILVGPNNSGKSLALREIENKSSGQNPITKVISDVSFQIPNDPNVALDLLRRYKIDPPEGNIETEDQFFIGLHTFRPKEPVVKRAVSIKSIKNAITNSDMQYLLPNLIGHYTVRLDGRTRFALASDHTTGDIKKSPENHLWALFQNDEARKKVRKLTKDAFGLYFVVDPTAMKNFSIRMSEKEPSNNSEEQGLDDNARKFHSAAQHISEFSDGVQAFVGLIAAILSLEHKVMLIDEPEAFLHPSLAFMLGENMAEIAEKRDATLIVATHSSEFLMSCIERAKSVSVVRLTYKDNVATARELSTVELKNMMNDPLLRSTKTLEALFEKAVVITESDTDRAFYDEINQRLSDETRGIGPCLFLNAQNKQTINRILQPLRKIGVPAVGIVDLDVISDGNTDWNNLMNSINLPDSEKSNVDQKRKKVMNEFNQPNLQAKNAIKKLGINSLQSEKTTAIELLDILADYGMFIVPTGEMESWLSNLGVGGHGPDWLIKIFSKLGSDKTDPNYIKSSKVDVWQFIDKIATWTDDPNRKGT